MLDQKKLTELIRHIKKGDKLAFRQLVEEYQQFAFSLAFRILCDEEEAKDAVQESFIKIWQKIESYDLKQKFSTWVYKIVTNKSIDRYRVIKRKHEINLDEATKVIEKMQFNTETILENKEISQIIGALAENLPEKQRIIFVLRDIQGLNSIEVEEILDLSSDSVKSNLYVARKTIREKLIPIFEFEGRLK